MTRPTVKTLGMLASPGTWSGPGSVLVGRAVANTQWLRALLRHGVMDEVALFVGEGQDVAALEALTAGWPGLERLTVYSLWQLPELLAQGHLDVLHHASHVERLYDLVALRDRFAKRAVVVTGQIHSLSYPRLHQEHARWPFVPPAPCDAIFCSSEPGKRTLEVGFDQVEAQARALGVTAPLPRWRLPVVPLGVDLEAVTGGDRARARARLQVPDGAVVLLCLARFTEYDKLDLFPVLQVLERLVHAPTPGAPPVVLVLAGARQGTKTPEMVELWARRLGVEHALRLDVDFPDDEKRHLLAAADVFISPVDNVQETFGQSVVEALAAGLPCVVSDFDGYRDTVDDTVGVRVPTRLGADWGELSDLAPLLYERPLHLVLGQSVEVDLRALEGALRALLVDRPRRERLGQAAAARARARYAWPTVVRQLEAVWAEGHQSGWVPSGRPHPLRLDFEQHFGHFFTEKLSPQRQLRLVPERLDQVIYPELKDLVSSADLALVKVFFAPGPRSVAELIELLGRTPGRPRWGATFVATWLVKHGVLE